MKKGLTIIALTLITSQLYCDYKFNPFTGKLDYYSNSVSSSSYSINSDKLDGYHADNYISTTTAFSSFLSTGVAQLLAGTNITLNPADGKGNVTVSATVPQQYWIGTATSALNMNSYAINSADSVYISTPIGQGYFQISDKYIVVSGTTSTAIQNAINSLGSSGGQVILLPQVYAINSRINLKSNMALTGSGAATKLISEPWANWATKSHTLYAQNVSNVLIRDLQLDGLAANTGQNFNLIEVSSVTMCKIDAVYAQYSDQHGIHVSGSNLIAITNCNAENNDSGGIFVDGYRYEASSYLGGYETVVMGCTARGNYDGIRANYTRAIVFQGNYLRGNTHYNIECDQANYGLMIMNNNIYGDGVAGGIHLYSGSFQASGNYVYNVAGRGIQADAVTSGSILNNVFDTTGYESIYLGDGLCSNVNIIGNTCKDAANTRNDINLARANNCLISNNNCSTSASGKSERAFYIQVGTNNVIMNNFSSGHDTAGLEVTAGAVGTKVINNIITDTNKITNTGINTIFYAFETPNYYGINNSSPTVALDVSGRIKVDNIWHVVGGTHTINTVIPGTKDNWSKLTNTGGTLLQVTDNDGFVISSDSITITNAGDYWGNIMLSYSANQGNDWSFRVRNVDTSAITMLAEGTSTTGNTNVVTVTMPIYLDAAAGNRYIIEAMNTSTDDDLTIHSAKFTIVYLHD